MIKSFTRTALVGVFLVFGICRYHTTTVHATKATEAADTVCMDLYFGAPEVRRRIAIETGGQKIVAEAQVFTTSEGYRRTVLMMPKGVQVEIIGGCNEAGAFILKDPLGMVFEGMSFPPPPYRVGQKWSYSLRISNPLPTRITLQCEITQIAPWTFNGQEFKDAVTAVCENQNTKTTTVYVPRIGKVSEENIVNGRPYLLARIISFSLPEESSNKANLVPTTPPTEKSRSPSRSSVYVATPTSTPPSESSRQRSIGDISGFYNLPLPRDAKNVERRQNSIVFDLPGGIRAQYIVATTKADGFVSQEDIIGIFVNTLDRDFTEKGWKREIEDGATTLYSGPKSSKYRWLGMHALTFSFKEKEASSPSGVVILVLGDKRSDVQMAINDLVVLLRGAR